MPSLDDDDKELFRVWRNILVMFIEADEDLGMSTKHLRLLELISTYNAREEICTPAMLAEITGWPRSTVSRLVGDLAGYGHKRHEPFISFEADKSNRRLKILRPTTEAARCKRDILKGMRAAFRKPNKNPSKKKTSR